MAKNKKLDISSLFYITHVANLPSILSCGILSHGYVEDHHVPYTPVYDSEIVANRKLKTTPDNQSLWKFANVYFQPRNPMLYRVVHEKKRENIAVVGVKPEVLRLPGVYVTDGNAANAPTSFYAVADGMKAIKANWKTIQNEWWNSVDGSKRKIMAECLIPTRIPPELVHSIYVSSREVAARVNPMVSRSNVQVIPEPNIFFLPSARYQIKQNLSLAEGDMFFSQHQTLTVSVNIVGIMGKGLASRAKYQFPDVYVMYQDACRKKLLRMGKPFLYKREAAVEDELTDEPRTLPAPNDVKWFLLFATKRHWRENSDLDGIREGLRWIVANYKVEGIRSIALPALGCGLGNLEWKDVGPLMCSELSLLDIPVTIYLPRERDIAGEFLTPQYLLKPNK